MLGGINSVDFPHAFGAKEEMKAWQFLKLNPEGLKNTNQARTRYSGCHYPKLARIWPQLYFGLSKWIHTVWFKSLEKLKQFFNPNLLR
jgi:hypothetical protein